MFNLIIITSVVCVCVSFIFAAKKHMEFYVDLSIHTFDESEWLSGREREWKRNNLKMNKI